jgi:hypothetical protein
LTAALDRGRDVAVRFRNDGAVTSQHDPGSAGASARREYERRKAKDEARIRETWGEGKLGAIAVALTPERQSTRAWITGAIGEDKVGRHLESVASEGIRVLHDRRIPGTRANIDHVVVTAYGVWVIDAKRYRDKRPALRVEGGFLRPRTETLLVGGRDQNKLVDGVLGQVERVRSAVGEVPVRGALCFIDADWPMIGGNFTTRGIDVLWPGKLLKMLQAPTDPLCDVAATLELVARKFPPAVRA